MIRRSLRIGIRLGLLSGLAFVLFKIVQARRSPPALPGSDDGWPQAPAPPQGGPAAPSVDVETAVAPGPAEPFAMVPTAGDAEAPPAPVEAAAPPKAAPPAQAAAKPRGPSPAAEAAARAAAESAAKKAVAKAVAAKGAAKAAAKAAATLVGPAEKGGAVRAPAEPAPGTAWVPAQEGACPSSHPIKAKLTSRIFHLPGMAAYQRTSADRCYPDEASAEADGLRKAKR